MASIARTGLLRQSRFTSVFARSPLVVRPATSLLSQTRAQLAPRSLTAAFTSSTRRQILPPGPQVIQGDVNDPAAVPKPHPTHGSYHWTAERAISVGLIPLTIAPFAGGSLNPTLDAVFVGAILVHSHMGFQSVIIDYIPNWEYPTWRKVFMWGLNLATLLVGIGFYEFETNDVGLTEAVKRIWRAGANDATIGKLDVDGLGHDGKLKHLVK